MRRDGIIVLVIIAALNMLIKFYVNFKYREILRPQRMIYKEEYFLKQEKQCRIHQLPNLHPVRQV